MEWEYITQQGDTWDVLARDIYGSEKLAGLIQAANPDYLSVLFFPSGIVLTLPQLPERASNTLDPPWKRKS